MRTFLSIVCVFTYSAVFSSTAHPYSITIVNADLQENKITLSIKTTAEDLLYFHALKYDSLFRLSKAQLMVAATEHKQKILAGFTILDQQRNRLPSVIVRSDFSSLNAKDQFDVMELLRFPLFYTLEFSMADGVEVLVFNQNLGQAGLPSISMLSIYKNGNSLVENVEVSMDKSFTLARDAISIGNSATAEFMLSYISLSDTRVTHELTLPMNSVRSIFPTVPLSSEATLRLFREFINENSSVEINNTVIVPEVTTIDFQSRGNYPVADTLLVNVRVEYKLQTLPKDVSITWSNFTWQMRWFKSLIDSFGQEKEHTFSRFQPTFKIERKVEIKKEN